MLGNGLIKKERKTLKTKSTAKAKAPKKVKRKISIEDFLKEILGTHLVEKKYKF